MSKVDTTVNDVRHKRKPQVKFNKKVIEENTKKFRFIRKLTNTILFQSDKDLNLYQLQKLVRINCKLLQYKMLSFTNKSTTDSSNCKPKNNTEKTNSISENDISLNTSDICCNNSLTPSRTIDLSSKYFDFEEIDESSSDELNELQPKVIREKHSITKILELRRLPDYKRIDKLLNTNDTTYLRRKRSLNAVVTRKPPVIFWNTYSFLLIEIENCITKKNWNYLTTLLIYLSGAVKKCEPLLLKATIVNFISNPSFEKQELLEEFLKECYSCRSQSDISNLLTQLFHIKPKENI